MSPESPEPTIKFIINVRTVGLSWKFARVILSYTAIMYKKEKAELWFLTTQIITCSRRMGGTPLFGGSWGPILQLDLENWMVFLEVVNLTYHILDFTLGQYSPDDPLNYHTYIANNNICILKINFLKLLFLHIFSFKASLRIFYEYIFFRYLPQLLWFWSFLVKISIFFQITQ